MKKGDADKELEIINWMTKQGYDRKASQQVAPIIVKYLANQPKPTESKGEKLANHLQHLVDINTEVDYEGMIKEKFTGSDGRLKINFSFDNVEGLMKEAVQQSRSEKTYSKEEMISAYKSGWLSGDDHPFTKEERLNKYLKQWCKDNLNQPKP